MMYLESFASYMQDLGVATKGQNLTIGEVPRQPDDEDIDEGQWWLVPAGGTSEGTNFNQWQRVLFINVFYRDRDARCVAEKFEDFRTLVHNNGCPELDGYKAVRIDVSSELTPQESDTEDDRVGVMIVRIILEQERSI